MLADALPFPAGESWTGGEGLCSGGGAMENEAREVEGAVS